MHSKSNSIPEFTWNNGDIYVRDIREMYFIKENDEYFMINPRMNPNQKQSQSQSQSHIPTGQRTMIKESVAKFLWDNNMITPYYLQLPMCDFPVKNEETSLNNNAYFKRYFHY